MQALAYFPNAQDEGSFIYFILQEEDRSEELGGFIKIGVARNPRARLRELQTGNPRLLRLIALCRGDLETEKWLHQELVSYRSRGEWFQLGTAWHALMALHSLEREYSAEDCLSAIQAALTEEHGMFFPSPALQGAA